MFEFFGDGKAAFAAWERAVCSMTADHSRAVRGNPLKSPPSNLVRRPIRLQILLPFAAVVLLAVAGTTLTAAFLAARGSERATVAHLQNVIDTLTQTNVPYTEAVLLKMRGLSGAHFVAGDQEGRVVATTLADGASDALEAAKQSPEMERLPGRTAIALGDSRYLVSRLEPRGDRDVRTLVVLYPEESWSRSRYEAALPPLVVGGIAVLVTIAVSAWLAERFSRRIGLLERQVAAIAEGDFRAISTPETDDEIGALIESVNRMADQLSRMRENERLTERTRLLGQLAGGLAHQLRNAVSGAKMALQLHQRRCAGASSDQSLAVALRQLSLTETQVRGLLSLGRQEPSRRVACALNDLVEDVAELLEPACEHGKIRLTVVAPAAEISVVADVESLRAAVLNLVQNGVEAAGPGGDVELRLTERSGEAQIEVWDGGPGPSPELAEALFEAFVTSKPEGIGLGLALARQVAAEHRGKLTWRREGERTVFTLTLPESRAAQAGSESSIPHPAAVGVSL